MFDRTPEDHVKKLDKASKRFARDRAGLLEDIVVELHELENLRNDLLEIRNEILIANQVGSLKDPQKGTCARPIHRLHGIFIAMRLAEDDGYSRAISTKQLGTAMKRKVESELVNNWSDFRTREQVLASYKEVLDEFMRLVKPKVEMLKQERQELRA